MDSQRLGRIAERDLEALDILYHQYARSAYGLALRRLGDRDGAEDATRRTFAAIWGFAATRVPKSGDGARWLFTVAENAIGGEASGRAHPVSRDEVSEVKPHPGPLELVYWEGRSQSEIAEQLGLPLGTIKTRTLRALVYLATSSTIATTAFGTRRERPDAGRHFRWSGRGRGQPGPYPIRISNRRARGHPPAATAVSPGIPVRSPATSMSTSKSVCATRSKESPADA